MDKVDIIQFPVKKDERGWIAWPVDKEALLEGGITNLHIPLLKPESVRGNHYHKNCIEFVLILNGTCRAVFLDNETFVKEEILIDEQLPVLFKIHPNTTHAFKNEGKDSMFLLCYEKIISSSFQGQDIHKKIICN